MKSLVIIILNCLSINLLAQSDSLRFDKYFIYACGGSGIPINSYTIEHAGAYAQNGPTFNISATLPVRNSIYNGMITLSFNSHPINLEDYLTYNYHDNVTWYYAQSAGNYTILSGMLGIAVNIPRMWKKECFYLCLLAGASEIFFPYENYLNTYIQGNQQLIESNNVSSVHGLGLSFGAGVGFKINIYSKLFLKLSADYMLTGGKIQAQDEVTDASGNVTDKLIETGGLISLFNATFGVGYRFGK